MITTQKELRAEFWQKFPQIVRRPGKTQNDYPAYIRLTWCDFVEDMRRDGQITAALAKKATL